MNYQQTIDYLYNKLPMFSRVGSAAFKKDLTNIRLLCESLGNVHTRFKSIHIAGTNGKGSVSHMLASVLQAAGYTTGLYTSPHLYDFRERIRVNGVMAGEEFVISFVEKIRPLVEEIQPSFFEVTVAMAFQYFAERKVDVAVIEVGLGGRLDSTNIITPELSVITNIGWDHMNMLGSRLEDIAVEKGGIIKQGIPVVIGETGEETAPVFYRIAREKNAPIFFADKHCKPISHEWKEDRLFIEVFHADENKTTVMELDLPGLYQQKNLCTVLTALDALKKLGFLLDEEDIHSGLRQVRKATGLSGRWEVLQHHPLLVLDVAHNLDGIGQLLHHLEQLPHKQRHLVFGMVKDKELEPILRLLPEAARYYFTQAHIPRALTAKELQQMAKGFALEGECYEDVNQALYAALEKAAAEDVVVVFGSIFLVAEVNKFLVFKHA